MTRVSTGRGLALLAVVAALVAAPVDDAAAGAPIGADLRVPCPGGGDCWPAAFDFTPNGRAIYYVERFTGRIRKHHLGTGSTTLFHRLRHVAGGGERGVLGLALDPRWPSKKWIYVFVSKDDDTNRIVRYRKRRDGRIVGQRLHLFGSNGNHNGGVLGFGPDGKLYAVTGDLGDPAKAQRKRSSAGKVLRMSKAGRRPSGNPFSNKTWSYGHRNSFGFAFDPETGKLWQTENGPQCDDEVNRIRRGRNFGWGPGSDCPGTSTEGPSPVQPRWTFTPVPALTGAAFCDGCSLGATAEGRLLVGAWNDGRIREAALTGNRLGVTGVTTLYDHPRGVMAVEAAPSGRIFFSDPGGIFRLERT